MKDVLKPCTREYRQGGTTRAIDDLDVLVVAAKVPGVGGPLHHRRRPRIPGPLAWLVVGVVVPTTVWRVLAVIPKHDHPPGAQVRRQRDRTGTAVSAIVDPVRKLHSADAGNGNRRPQFAMEAQAPDLWQPASPPWLVHRIQRISPGGRLEGAVDGYDAPRFLHLRRFPPPADELEVASGEAGAAGKTHGGLPAALRGRSTASTSPDCISSAAWTCDTAKTSPRVRRPLWSKLSSARTLTCPNLSEKEGGGRGHPLWIPHHCRWDQGPDELGRSVNWPFTKLSGRKTVTVARSSHRMVTMFLMKLSRSSSDTITWTSCRSQPCAPFWKAPTRKSPGSIAWVSETGKPHRVGTSRARGLAIRYWFWLSLVSSMAAQSSGLSTMPSAAYSARTTWSMARRRRSMRVSACTPMPGFR